MSLHGAVFCPTRHFSHRRQRGCNIGADQRWAEIVLDRLMRALLEDLVNEMALRALKGSARRSLLD
ncbi:hypothetical protein A3216_09690 [Mycobacterium leprae 7935681]|nr:hypothetical protein A3216_09690 [Mycobacterium leprae 7935681]